MRWGLLGQAPYFSDSLWAKSSAVSTLSFSLLIVLLLARGLNVSLLSYEMPLSDSAKLSTEELLALAIDSNLLVDRLYLVELLDWLATI